MKHFASIYDELMQDAPYDLWQAYALRYLPPGSRVLDLACGTGELTLQLEEAGLRMDGVDLSFDMLSEAEQKARARNSRVSFYRQDMTELEGFQDLDGVTLFCDGLNYLPDGEAVRKAFSRVFDALRPGGVFLFDVHSTKKMEELFQDELYGEDRGDLAYLWFAEAGEVPYSVHHQLTFFVEEADGRFRREEETLMQRTFPQEKYISWLKDAGFQHAEVTADFGLVQHAEEADRLLFYARKPN
ncbi:class I SAM-dependent DNA methyltransferase [Alkalicoccus urumqiensis]|uniref:Class I SAM-dependent methyltransferase n=1 Tax=Alkalicoccus urumqiensis TaxID=1548213 RepID=A0A2P6MFQ3_ALKUR|nr:class I SAM-dependent methyltransferase [Alkalicoccus urumqiensis]PRO65081.1 class I SAM-dependent methyltransferase [Alkalicoccus urumqiensis]